MSDQRREQIVTVLNSIPNEQYADGYVDPKGKAGFRNPVREVVGVGLTNVIEKLGIKNGVELGTALGRSGLHFALGGLEQLDTVEFDGEAASEAQNNFDRAGLNANGGGFHVYNMDSGQFTAEYEKPVDMVFIDHAKERYLEDFQNLEDNLTPTALVLMDNTFNRASECKDAVAYVADNYFAAIFTEPSSAGQTGAETTGLLVASKDRATFDTAFTTLMDTRAEA